jgi:hypothetical protein
MWNQPDCFLPLLLLDFGLEKHPPVFSEQSCKFVLVLITVYYYPFGAKWNNFLIIFIPIFLRRPVLSSSRRLRRSLGMGWRAAGLLNPAGRLSVGGPPRPGWGCRASGRPPPQCTGRPPPPTGTLLVKIWPFLPIFFFL